MRIMTSNIWGDYFNNPTAIRDDKLYGIYLKYAPDVVGFQEVTRGWYGSTLFQRLSQDYYFVGTDGVNSGNFVPMAIRKGMTLIDSGFEYLENTPDNSKAITWAVVEQNGVKFALCNTHFWWMRGTEPESLKKAKGVLEYSLEDHCDLRADNAKQLVRLMTRIFDQYSCPVFAFGDMNATVTEGVFDVYEQNGVKRLFDMAEQKDTVCSIHGDPVKDGEGIYRGTIATEQYLSFFRRALCLSEYAGEAGYLTSIDHIVGLGDGFVTRQYRIVEDQDALDATDHSPVFADVDFIS